jgi:hypothetical protein
MALQPRGEMSVLPMLRPELEALPEVEAVLIDDASQSIWLICSRTAPPRLADDARRVVASHDLDPAAVTIEVAMRSERLDRRARFDRTERFESADRQVRIRVALEWEGNAYYGDATGEAGHAIELRTAAAAALEALERLTGEELSVRLVGVKQVRAFDAELTVVSLYRVGAPSHKLLGTVLTGADPHRAAALAVLNALNRHLGNLLNR